VAWTGAYFGPGVPGTVSRFTVEFLSNSGTQPDSGGDGKAYQDFFGTRSHWSADTAFTLTDGGRVVSSTPEPVTFGLAGSTLIALMLRRRKRA
jgi:hypothetical protein